MTAGVAPAGSRTRSRRSIGDRLAGLRSWRRANRLAVLVMIAVAVAISVATVAVPASAWWGERNEGATRQTELDGLEAEIASLERRRDALETPRRIEELARSRYDLVYPHEEAYAVLPSPERDAAWLHDWPY